MYRKFLKNFTITAAILFIAAAALVLFFDPFFHYHKPLEKLAYPIDSERYQNDGISSNFT